MTFTTIRKYFNIILFQKLIVAAILISILSSFLAISLKHITEYLELSFLLKATKQNFLMFVFPIIGFFVIHFLRHYLFKKKENKAFAIAGIVLGGSILIYTIINRLAGL